ncbi:MAG TPA: FG-GAP-like repeat-containing protein [Acidobacteriaceae bacterium]|jgi:hypothetical protein
MQSKNVTAAGQEDNTTASTREMAATLRAIFAAQDWKTDPNKPAERVVYYRGVLKEHKLDLPTEITLREALATELLGAGDNAGAVAELDGVRHSLSEHHVRLPAAQDHDLHIQAGLAYLRLGEQENCLAHHSMRSCFFPIDASGKHQKPQGAEGAVREYTAALAIQPDDAGARWLLNLAYMQLGRYPQDVPSALLIPSNRFRSEYSLPAFPDIAPEAGLAVTGHAGGVVMEDFDGDGLLDLAVTSSGPNDPMHLFHNNGNGAFTDVTRKVGLAEVKGGLNLICADYDNDGHPDLLVLRGGWWGKHGAYPLSLLRNRGDGTFTDVTRQAGLFAPHPTQTAAWADFDGDGWLDLWVPHESTPGDPRPSKLFHNNRDGTFTDIAAASGMGDMGFAKATAWGDFNNDGRPDLYVSIKGKPNRLLRNDGPWPGDDPAKLTRWRFTDVTQQAGVTEPIESFTTWFFDYDNDGWHDLFVAGYSSTPGDVGAFEAGLPNHAEVPRLYHNEHNGTFRDVTHAVGMDRTILVMGASFGDLDNDGFLDVYLGTGDSLYSSLLPNHMFRNAAGKRFQDVTTAGGFGHLQKGHSVAFGDLSNSGSEDVFEEVGGAQQGDSYQSVLYRNPGTPGTHSVTLLLEGRQSNRSAIGARVRVILGAGSSARSVYRTVGFGSSFGGNPLRQHIGFGTWAGPVSVEVEWPRAGGAKQRFEHLPADHTFRLVEGEKTAQVVTLPKFKLRMPEIMHEDMEHAGP